MFKIIKALFVAYLYLEAEERLVQFHYQLWPQQYACLCRLNNAGMYFRAYFLIDNTGIIRARVVGDLPVALDIDGLPAKIKRIQEATAKKSWFQEMRDKMKED